MEKKFRAARIGGTADLNPDAPRMKREKFPNPTVQTPVTQILTGHRNETGRYWTLTSPPKT
jgi:hypothetical protein